MNEKQQQAVLMMTEGKLYQEIAKELGVTSKTISQWRADPEFRATLNQHLENIKTAHSERLRNLQGIALETLEECLKDPKFSAKDKLAAAFKILDIGGIKIQQPGSTNAEQIRAEDNFNLFRF